MYTKIVYLNRLLKIALQQLKIHGIQLCLGNWIYHHYSNLKYLPILRSLIHLHRVIFDIYCLGFTESGLHELNQIVDNCKYVWKKKSAAWELALWHANRCSKEDAGMSIAFTEIVLKRAKNKHKILHANILKAECLLLLSKRQDAKEILFALEAKNSNADLFLAMANLVITLEEKIHYVNKALLKYNLEKIKLNMAETTIVVERLVCNTIDTYPDFTRDDQPLISVIIPAFNSEATLHIALSSLQKQTYKNLEIIVVDDCSTDRTVVIAESYRREDFRIKILQTSFNQGAYVARNTGLASATGTFVTCHDADDWSHPQKLEIQAKHLFQNPLILGNTSQLTRVLEDFTFFRRNLPGYYIQTNLSSLMFRRNEVLHLVGYWDSVRFGADDEYIHRIRKLAGFNSIVSLETGPLSFAGIYKHSLTNHSAFGYYGYFMGARKEYRETYLNFHKNATAINISFPIKKRPFPVPAPLLPEYNKQLNIVRDFDVILASDFRLIKSSLDINLKLLREHIISKNKTGIVQISIYQYPQPKYADKIRKLIISEQIPVIVYGEEISCKELIIPFPETLLYHQNYMPKIRAEKIFINCSRKLTYTQSMPPDQPAIKQYEKYLIHYFGKDAEWHELLT